MSYFSKFIIILCTLFLGACNNTSAPKKDKIFTRDSIPDVNKKMVTNIGVVLLPKSAKMLRNWSDYQELDAVLTRFYAISPNEAFSRAQELELLTAKMKDSIAVERLDNNAVKMRFNVLHNEVLRLKDMSNISNITRPELKKQIEKIINAYSATNSKINSLVSIDALEEELKDFESEMLKLSSQVKTVAKTPAVSQSKKQKQASGKTTIPVKKVKSNSINFKNKKLYRKDELLKKEVLISKEDK